MEWLRRYNGTANTFDIVNSLRLDGSSNAYVFGSASSNGTSTDIAVIKYSPSGNIVWSRLFDGYSNALDQCNASYLDNSGNSYITGFTSDTNLVLKMLTIKYGLSGDIMWSRVFLPAGYSQGMGYSVTADNSGNVFSAGNFTKQNGTQDIIVVKYNSNGNIADSVTYNTDILTSENTLNLLLDNAGNVFILGAIQSQALPRSVLVVKFNQSLNPVWSKTLSGSSALADMPVQMIWDNSGKLIVCMASNNAGGGLDYGMYKLDTNSTVLNEYSYNGIGNNQDIPYAVCTDNNNNIFVTGSSRNADSLGSEDIVTIKLNSSLQQLWLKIYNGVSYGIDYGTCLTTDSENNLYVGGAYEKQDNHLGYALLKYEPAGDLQWVEQYSNLLNSEDFVYSVAVDNSHNIFLTGISFDSLTDFDFATIKYSQPIGITQVNNNVPQGFLLEQNYPNPFNPSTKIRFSIPAAQFVELKVYDALGREHADLVNSRLTAGTYEINWYTLSLPAGIYFYRLRTDNFAKSMKMMLVK